MKYTQKYKNEQIRLIAGKKNPEKRMIQRNDTIQWWDMVNSLKYFMKITIFHYWILKKKKENLFFVSILWKLAYFTTALIWKNNLIACSKSVSYFYLGDTGRLGIKTTTGIRTHFNLTSIMSRAFLNVNNFFCSGHFFDPSN